MNSGNSRESYHHPIVRDGDRPKIKSWMGNVAICESAEEMCVRVNRLRKPGDLRSAQRILDGLSTYWIRTEHRRHGNE